MKGNLKKILSAILVTAMSVGMCVSASAATLRETGVRFRMIDTNLVMNAYTWGTPANGTKITLYTSDGSASQRFYTSNHKLYNQLTDAVVVGKSSTTNMAVFVPKYTSDTYCYFDVVPFSDLGWKFQLVHPNKELGTPANARSGTQLQYYPLALDDDINVWIMNN